MANGDEASNRNNSTDASLGHAPTQTEHTEPPTETEKTERRNQQIERNEKNLYTLLSDWFSINWNITMVWFLRSRLLL